MCENSVVRMTAAPQKNLATRKALFALLLVAMAGAGIYTVFYNPPWNVPEEAKQARNPLQPSDAALKSIGPIYLDKCASCHGDSGRGDGHDASLYDPPPTNFTDTKVMQGVKDGELFYKMTQGRRPMPSFRKRLTDEQRWQMVLLIRSFAVPPSGTPTNAAATADPTQKH
jgi:mono/diheme cytochrome c family protein